MHRPAIKSPRPPIHPRRWQARRGSGSSSARGSARSATRSSSTRRSTTATCRTFLKSTAVGHKGRLLCGRLAGVPVVAMQGRFHCYEGYSAERATFPVRVMKELGIELLDRLERGRRTEPAVRRRRRDGHRRPHQLPQSQSARRRERRPPRPAVPRHVVAVRPGLGDQALAIARKHDFVCHRGMYIAVLGPTYETRAEIRMLRAWGDAVGMSTVPEVIVAVHAGLQVLGLSTITNVCSPDIPHTTSGDEVVATANTAKRQIARDRPRHRRRIRHLAASLHAFAAYHEHRPPDLEEARRRGARRLRNRCADRRLRQGRRPRLPDGRLGDGRVTCAA